MWTCRAPSNIALIKYMGKTDDGLPCNSSLSYTLHNYYTEVTLTPNQEADIFINAHDFSESAADRFLTHLSHIKRIHQYDGYFSIYSTNNFPHSAGIASSASSFAALTMCAAKAIGSHLPISQLSELSRKGSGSSCRSFFSPWSIWDKNGAHEITIDQQELIHDVVMVDNAAKHISSSAAHQLVKTSRLFDGRPQRAEQRLSDLVTALNKDRWYDAYQLCWEEFQDMHALFHTSSPHFSYFQPKTIDALHCIAQFWESNKAGPIVTIDAGPNIHLLWKTDQHNLRQILLNALKISTND